MEALKKLQSSATIWLGALVEVVGQFLDLLYKIDMGWGGLSGIRQQLTDAGLDAGTLSITLQVLGPIIVLARLRTLLRS